MPKTPDEVIARLQRAREHAAQHIYGLVCANARLKYELRELEDLLSWIHRTEQPVEAIRGAIEKRIQRRISEDAA